MGQTSDELFVVLDTPVASGRPGVDSFVTPSGSTVYFVTRELHEQIVGDVADYVNEQLDKIK